MLALEYLKDTKVVLDPGRQFYEAALLFHDMDTWERAIHCYNKAIISRNSPERIVLEYDLPEDEAYHRKVKFLSSFQIEEYMRKRQDKKNWCVYAEQERQRYRSRSCYSQLFQIQLLSEEPQIFNPEAAHEALRHMFTCCANAAEHNEVLHFAHILIKDFATKRLDEIPLEKQIIRSSCGPIAEAHLSILHELLLLEPQNLEIYEWLGIRYAERCDFDDSEYYYRKIRDFQAPYMDKQDTLAIWRVPPGKKSYEQIMLEKAAYWNTHKKKIRDFSSADPTDEEWRAKREDHSWFGGTHNRADIVYYQPPLQGWNDEGGD